MMPAVPYNPVSSRMQRQECSDFYGRWVCHGPPLRPPSAVPLAMRELIARHDAHVLLLGVTPELADIATRTCAVDRSRQMVSGVWPGDTGTRRAVRGNWLNLPCGDGVFSAAIGDGSFNCLEFPHGYIGLFAELARALRPGAPVIARVYLAPAGADSLTRVRSQALAGAISSIHVLKWRIAHAVCAERRSPNVPVQAIRDAFNSCFRDRTALRRATGWSVDAIASIDAYAGLSDVYSFPTLCDLRRALAPLKRWRLVPAGSYELAEHCPLLVADVHA